MTKEISELARDANGLFPHVQYPRRDNGAIDWKKLINPAHIVFNSKNERIAAEIETSYGSPAKSLVYADIAAKQTIEDKHILVLLKGWQELAELRGFSSSVPTSISVAPGVVAVAWTIKWIPNQDDPKGKETGATADATMENTGGFGYLGAMAGNRAFVRAVRQGLGIQILAYDEIAMKGDMLPEAGVSNGAAAGSASPSLGQLGQPVPLLERTCAAAKLSFQRLKSGVIEKYRDKVESNPDLWNSFEDIPPRDCLTLTILVKEGKKKA